MITTKIKQIGQNRAFALIEIMLSISMVMILAAIAIPGYQQYLIKAQVAEGFVLVNNLQQAESIYYAKNNSFTSLTELGISIPSGQYVSNVSLDSITGNITISYGGSQANNAITNTSQIMLSPVVDKNAGQIDHWNCYTQGTMKEQYAPSSCHNSGNGNNGDNANTTSTISVNPNSSSSSNQINGFDNFEKTHKDQLIR